jgi:methionine aminopeptidase
MGYKGYPASLRTSVNAEALYGIPNKRVMKEGGIITIFPLDFRGAICYNS